MYAANAAATKQNNYHQHDDRGVVGPTSLFASLLCNRLIRSGID